MASIRRCELPHGALLSKYQRGGAYADCYVTQIARRVSHAEYVEAFYTTSLFKIERLLLAWFVAKPSTDLEASQLAAGTRGVFAAWNVEARNANQLLMSDYQSRTRSWLMVTPIEDNASDDTRLYFGSAVIPAWETRSGTRTLGLAFRLLLGFHKLYSRALLFATRTRLVRLQPTEQ